MGRGSRRVTYLATTDLSGFWGRVDKTDSCWLWTGPRRSKGYGSVSLWGATRGTHRVSWEIHFGPIPAGLCVCHHCDNPSCVNPGHLFTGTIADNNTDKMLKGRASRRLTASQVLEIRASSKTGSALAREYGVSQSTVSGIVLRKSWKHV